MAVGSLVLPLLLSVARGAAELDSRVRLVAEVGPLGLAFSSEVAAVQALSCESMRGRPFVTGLHVQQLHAPLGGRDGYEFRVQCGPATSAWTDLGPRALLWAAKHQGVASCPRPQSARGLVVTRGRTESSRADLFGFSLLCGLGQGDELAAVDGLIDNEHALDESRGRQCPEGSFVSGIEISRGFEPHGAYDLYEFRLRCSEVGEPPPKFNPASGPSGRSAGSIG